MWYSYTTKLFRECNINFVPSVSDQAKLHKIVLTTYSVRFANFLFVLSAGKSLPSTITTHSQLTPAKFTNCKQITLSRRFRSNLNPQIPSSLLFLTNHSIGKYCSWSLVLLLSPYFHLFSVLFVYHTWLLRVFSIKGFQ